MLFNKSLSGAILCNTFVICKYVVISERICKYLPESDAIADSNEGIGR